MDLLKEKYYVHETLKWMRHGGELLCGILHFLLIDIIIAFLLTLFNSGLHRIFRLLNGNQIANIPHKAFFYQEGLETM